MRANRGSGAEVAARLPPGLSIASAEHALNQHALQVRDTLPEMADVKVSLRSILAEVVGDYTETTTILTIGSQPTLRGGGLTSSPNAYGSVARAYAERS